MKLQKNVSIKDVAKAANVSVATVSRIINNNGRFSETTKIKVEQVINELGYEQNKLAVSLRSNESNTIGIMVPDITNEFFAAIVKKCEQRLFSAGYSSIICNTERSPEREQEYFRVLQEHRVDGLIIISSQESVLNLSNYSMLPILYIDRDPHSKSESIVSSDHHEGGKIATQYLLDLNLTPYLVMTRTESSATLDRVRGFKEILLKNSYQDPASHIISLDLTSDQFLKAAPQLNIFLERIAKQKKIGIFAINDNIAYMVIRAATQLGINIPNDLSVIGYDGTSYSEISSPRITTIVQNVDLISEHACSILINQIQDGKKQNNINYHVVSVPVYLDIKESTIKAV